MERFENWQWYSFDDGPARGSKPTPDSTFNLHFNKDIKTKDMNFFDSLYYNARMLADTYSEPFDVCFSGGIDSELILRINKELGIKQNAYVVRFENDYNAQDYNDAVKVCTDLDIKLNVIDFNLKKHVENDLYDIAKKTNLNVIERMVRLSWFDYFDNIPVLAEGEPYWKRELGADYSKKSEWRFWWCEDYNISSIYADQIGRTVIGEWYNFTPEVAKAWPKLPFLKDRLFQDKIVGKLSCWSSRREVYLEKWPDIYNRPKYTGYEGANGVPGTMPPFMEDFKANYLDNIRNVGYSFSEAELDEVLETGKGTCNQYDVRYTNWNALLTPLGQVQTLN